MFNALKLNRLSLLPVAALVAPMVAGCGPQKISQLELDNPRALTERIKSLETHEKVEIEGKVKLVYEGECIQNIISAGGGGHRKMTEFHHRYGVSVNGIEICKAYSVDKRIPDCESRIIAYKGETLSGTACLVHLEILDESKSPPKSKEQTQEAKPILLDGPELQYESIRNVYLGKVVTFPAKITNFKDASIGLLYLLRDKDGKEIITAMPKHGSKWQEGDYCVIGTLQKVGERAIALCDAEIVSVPKVNEELKPAPWSK